jgi:HPt (histidine-containing phosphotransfer) domain-containing protein
MDDFLTKPLGSDELDRALGRWLPRAAAASDPGSIDPARINDLRSLFPGAEAAEVLVALVTEVGDDLDRLDAALHADDGAGVAAAAHSIRGSAQLIGAARLADAAAEVEHAAKAHGPSEPGIAALREAWDQTRAGIEAQIADDRATVAKPYHQMGTD